MAELTEKRVEDLFADLRASELHRVRPPGAATTRSTVRRRRVARSVTAGVAAMAGVTAAGLTGILPAGGAKNEPARQPLSQAALVAHRNAAASALGINPWAQVTRELSGQLTLTAEHHESHPVVAGTYSLRMSCLGSGTTTVVVRQRETKKSTMSRPDDTQVIASIVVPCTEAAGAQTTDITVAQDILYVDVIPDDDAEGAAGFAYTAELTGTSMERLRMRAAEALDLPDDELGSRTYFLKGSTEGEYTHLGPGTYRLKVACVGAGSVSVEATPIWSGSAETASTSTKVFCRQPADAAEVPVTVRAGGGVSTITVTLVPNRAATRQAAVALKLIQE